jgi:hypothetical protein
VAYEIPHFEVGDRVGVVVPADKDYPVDLWTGDCGTVTKATDTYVVFTHDQTGESWFRPVHKVRHLPKEA